MNLAVHLASLVLLIIGVGVVARLVATNAALRKLLMAAALRQERQDSPNSPGTAVLMAPKLACTALLTSLQIPLTFSSRPWFLNGLRLSSLITPPQQIFLNKLVNEMLSLELTGALWHEEIKPLFRLRRQLTLMVIRLPEASKQKEAELSHILQIDVIIMKKPSKIGVQHKVLDISKTKYEIEMRQI